jgi:BirA family biotin operon repressor/biotin-[acetyl-CoA-carboxylase] ligase
VFKTITPTLFLGKNLIDLPTCESTNLEAHAYLQNPFSVEGTVIITTNQTAGRGQRGNIWQAKAGENLTFSLILMPHFLTIAEQFKLNVMITVGMADALKKYVPIQIKWSNDMYVNGKKLGGILIENSVQKNTLQNSIIGIGLNINQIEFELATATSLKKETNTEFDLQTILQEILVAIESRYLQLRSGQYDLLKTLYLQQLYRYQEWHFYQSEQTIFKGMIIGIDEYGRLAIQVENEPKIRYFDVKEVAFL